MNAEIITIGDEILIGQIVDTNSAWIARKLGEIGVRIKQITSVGDEVQEILEALKGAEERADLILITGGLGPTKDDITKKTLATYFGVSLKQDNEALENLKSIMARFSRPLSELNTLLEINRQQAEVLDNCKVIQNSKGTAPGMWIEEREKIFVSMPGVPMEMMAMVTNYLIPKLLERGGLPAMVHQTILTAGIAESVLSKNLENIEERLPTYIKLAYLPKQGQVRLRLSAYGESKFWLQKEVNYWTNEIIPVVKEHLIMLGDGSLAEAILKELQEKNKTLSLAESCTGGAISREITQLSGASKSYLGGMIPYSNNLKIKLLKVNPQSIDSFGAVSEEVVKEMVVGVLETMGSDFGISVSGIAGPEGGSSEKPVGTVWIAWGNHQKVFTKKYNFGGDRLMNIERATTAALFCFLSYIRGL